MFNICLIAMPYLPAQKAGKSISLIMISTYANRGGCHTEAVNPGREQAM